jgi:hypothetical protein
LICEDTCSNPALCVPPFKGIIHYKYIHPHESLGNTAQRTSGDFAQSDKKSDGASDAQSLCGVAFIL